MINFLFQLIGEFLSSMGHNVVSSQMIGRVTDKKTTEEPNYPIEDTQTSFFNLQENSLQHNFSEGPNPYERRRVGITKKHQEKEDDEQQQWWRGQKCPACKGGFNSKSTAKQCHQCDKYTHLKTQCLGSYEEGSVYLTQLGKS